VYSAEATRTYTTALEFGGPLQDTMNKGRSSQPRSASLGLLRIARNEAFSSTQEAAQTLTAMFDASDYLDCIKDLNAYGVDPQSYINGLDAVSPHPSLGQTCLAYNDLADHGYYLSNRSSSR